MFGIIGSAKFRNVVDELHGFGEQDGFELGNISLIENRKIILSVLLVLLLLL